MSGNALILYNDVVQAMALTASSQAVDDLGDALEAANLQLEDLGSLWRATGKAAEWVRGVAPAPVAADTFFLIGHNMTQAAEYDLKLYSDAAFTTLAYEETGLVWKAVYGIGEATMEESTIGGLPVRSALDEEAPRRLIRLAAPVTFQAFELSLRDGANADGYVQLAVFIAGVGSQPGFNFELGAEFGVGADDEVETLGRGALWVRRGASWGEHRVTFADLSKSEADGFVFDFMRRVRRSKPFLFVAYPEGRLEEWRTTLYCVLTADPRRTKRDQDNYAIELSMREIVG